MIFKKNQMPPKYWYIEISAKSQKFRYVNVSEENMIFCFTEIRFEI